ncbi:RNase E specificity factor CsrD [Sodalis sp. (in: enterobacteria)]|uniref:RNase E specificity factor CsrD n=1 Tax=Sodalis sp. (in: enterobacteria) TaxID=1898979 RepID=UPI003F2B9246
MRLNVRLSAMTAMLCALVTLLMLAGSALSYFRLHQQRLDRQLTAMADSFDRLMLTEPLPAVAPWLPLAMDSAGITRLELLRRGETVYHLALPPGSGRGDPLSDTQRQRELPLPRHPDYRLVIFYTDTLASDVHSLGATAPVSVALGLILVFLFLALRWLRRQIQPQESLETRARRIIYGERENVGEQPDEIPSLTGSAIDRLLRDLAQAREQRSRVDILIRAFAAHDARTGLTNRLSFDSQLALQLEDNQDVGAHGVVLLIMRPDPERLADRLGPAHAAAIDGALINLVSVSVKRYPDALLAHYFRDDLAVLLPHCSLKEAESLTHQLLGALATLPDIPAACRDDLLHIGVSAYRPGQTAVEVMESAEHAAREAGLQGGNGWSVYDNRVPQQARGNVKWRTLLENTLTGGGPQLLIRPAFGRDGALDHYIVINRIQDGADTLTAAEFLPVMRQLGLAQRYERQQLLRLIPLLSQLPGVVLSIAISVDSLLQRDFRHWSRDTLMQCGKSVRSQIMFELVEADLCQHLEPLRPALRLLTGLGCLLTVNRAGMTLVSTGYISMVPISVIKLHPGLVRDIDRRQENQLFVQSLPEACIGTRTRVFATGVRSAREWQTLLDHAVAGGEGDFFAPIAPLGELLKKYSRFDPRLV